jgi:hypothetical protein
LGIHLVLLVLCLAIARDDEHWIAKWLLPVCNFLFQIVAAASIFWITSQWPLLVAIVACLAGGTVVGGLLFGIYFFITSRFGWMWNNAYSPLACEDYKGFLRFRIDAAGVLTGYFFGCDRVPRQCKRNPAPVGIVTGDVRPAWTEADPSKRAQWRLVDRFELGP